MVWCPDVNEKEIFEKIGDMPNYRKFKEKLHCKVEETEDFQKLSERWYQLAYSNVSSLYNLYFAYEDIKGIKSSKCLIDLRKNIKNFFSNAMSVLDTIAQQILIVCTEKGINEYIKLHILKPQINCKKFKNIIDILENTEKNWYNEFKLYRIMKVHSFYILIFTEKICNKNLCYCSYLLNLQQFASNNGKVNTSDFIKRYKNNPVHSGEPKIREYYKQISVVGQCEEYLVNIRNLSEEIWNILKNNYIPHIK